MLLPRLRIGCLLILLAAAPSRVTAQVHDHLRVALALHPTGTRAETFASEELSPPSDSAAFRALAQPPMPRRRCRQEMRVPRIVLEPAIGAAAGALLGALTYHLTLGAWGPGKDDESRRFKRRYILAGTSVGAAYGVFQVLVVPSCPAP